MTVRQELAIAADMAKHRQQPTIDVVAKAIIEIGGESLLNERERLNPSLIATIDTNDLVTLCGGNATIKETDDAA